MPDPIANILVVDDDRIILESVVELLKLEGYSVDHASSLKDAIHVIDRGKTDLIVSDINMPGGDGFELLSVIKQRVPDVVVLMMTAYGTIESAVEAIKMGAYDYLTKPIIDEEFILAIQRGLAQRVLLRENHDLKQQLDRRYSLDRLVGHSPVMAGIFDLIETVADSNTTVLLQGPSGTGKSLSARVIHRLSARKNKPFIEVAAGALPDNLLESELFGHVRGAFTGAVAHKKGKFEAADGGTIFLDEIGTASPALQVKLLRVLQERSFEPVGGNTTQQVDVRVVVATNLDLEEEVRAGRFREDLFYRVSVVTIDLPPLIQRLVDVPILARTFLDQHRAESDRNISGFTDDAMHCMQRYSWPGNIRELANVVERGAVLCRDSSIDLKHLPQKLIQHAHDAIDTSTSDDILSLRLAMEETERRIVEAVLRANNWNRQLAAIQLDINRTTLYKKMKRYGLDNPNG